MTTEEKQQRLDIATKAMQGLLSSQNPKEGWNLEVLSILSLKIADTILSYSEKESLPELTTKKEEE